MKNFKKLIAFAIVSVMAFASAFSVTAVAEGDNTHECCFYTVISIDQETGDTVYTVAADASAHLSNFTIEFTIDVEMYLDVGYVIMASFERAGIDPESLIERWSPYSVQEQCGIVPVYDYYKYIYEFIAGDTDGFPSYKDVAEQEIEDKEWSILKIFLEDYFLSAEFANDASRLINLTKSPALNGLLNSGTNHDDEETFYTVMYNGVSNLDGEFAYEIDGNTVVDLFTLKVPSLPAVTATIEGAGDVTFPGFPLFNMRHCNIAAGTMEGGRVIPLECSCIDQCVRPGDYDLDGEVTVRDLVAYQLYNTQSLYAERMIDRNLLYLPMCEMAKSSHYDNSIAVSAENGQYLQMYLCDIIDYGEYCNRIVGSGPWDMVFKAFDIYYDYWGY